MMPNTKAALDRIIGALSGLRVPATPGEYDLHAMIAGAFAAADIAFSHEVTLAPRCRIDFMVGDVGIEVKKTHVSARALKAQTAKYLASDKLAALVLITTRGASLPATIASKPVMVLGLNRLWGVALP